MYSLALPCVPSQGSILLKGVFKLNINNQAENKKPFGTRLFILLTVCMIVVAMAVPAFAAPPGTSLYTGKTLGTWWTLSVNQDGFLVFDVNGASMVGTDDVSGNTTYAIDVSVFNKGTADEQIRVAYLPFYSTDPQYLIGSGLYLQIYAKPSSNFTGFYFLYYTRTGVIEYRNASGPYPATYYVNSGYNIIYDHLVYSTLPIYVDGVEWIPPDPPAPDLGERVSGVLPTVLSWIQQTLNALFVEGGALQGLLLLVAVPVAITLLLVGARFVRRLIWGA